MSIQFLYNDFPTVAKAQVSENIANDIVYQHEYQLLKNVISTIKKHHFQPSKTAVNNIIRYVEQQQPEEVFV